MSVDRGLAHGGCIVEIGLWCSVVVGVRGCSSIRPSEPVVSIWVPPQTPVGAVAILAYHNNCIDTVWTSAALVVLWKTLDPGAAIPT